jgi:hypothetical protein
VPKGVESTGLAGIQDTVALSVGSTGTQVSRKHWVCWYPRGQKVLAELVSKTAESAGLSGTQRAEIVKLSGTQG